FKINVVYLHLKLNLAELYFTNKRHILKTYILKAFLSSLPRMRKGFLFLQKDMEKCTKCGINDKHHKNYCKECFNKQQRERRAKNNNASTKKYEKTKK